MKTREIAEIIAGELIGDPDVEIGRLASLVGASAGDITFSEKADTSIDTGASCVLVGTLVTLDTDIPYIRVKSPKVAFSLIGQILHPSRRRDPEIHSTAVIAPSAVIGTGVFIGAFVCIGEHSSIGNNTQLRAGAKVGDNVQVGTDCVFDPNVFVDDNCTIGNSVILHSGVVIGTDGFGFVRDESGYIKFPQIGTVIIENDVEIGANSCVDRGALGLTRIGEGTKIDNLVQIAHNVSIGKRVVIAAQTGISGSTVIEDDCVIGGQVGMGDHATVRSGAIIGSQAGVLPGKIVRPGVWWGTPVQPLDEYKRQNAMVKGLSRLRDEVKELRARLASVQKPSGGK